MSDDQYLREEAGAVPEPPDSEMPIPRPETNRRGLVLAAATVAAVLLAAGILIAMNSAVGAPVARALNSDARNEVFAMKAHLGSYVDSSVLVLDLRDAGEAAALDLWRGLFQAAQAFHDSGRTFKRVVLARGGEPVFLIAGEDFERLGAQYAAGENPVYLLRTLPEDLRTPAGEAAYASWEGGLLGVATEQLNDVNDAARVWASGE